MKKNFPLEFIYQLFSLLVVFIIVHALFITIIRPTAARQIEAQRVQLAADPQLQTDDSFYIIVQGYEQETCIILMLWALCILAYKSVSAYRQNRLLDDDVLGLPEDMPIGMEDTRALTQQIRDLPGSRQNTLMFRSLLLAIERFRATGNVQDAATTAHDVIESQGERMESELSVIRYISWAIPSIGFIGTVRGIGDALGKAHQAVEGDITGVTESLGLAFNSTFIALVLSIILMFFVHQLQLSQERLVLDTEQYVDHWLIRRLRGRPPSV